MLKNRLILKYALLIFVFVGLYFLLMKMFHLEHIKELRLLNIIIVIFFTIRMAKEITTNEDGLDYLQGLFSLLLANLLGVALSVAGLAIYMALIPKCCDDFQNWIFWGEPTTMGMLIAIFFEGFAASIVVAFGIMQYFKKEKTP